MRDFERSPFCSISELRLPSFTLYEFFTGAHRSDGNLRIRANTFGNLRQAPKALPVRRFPFIYKPFGNGMMKYYEWKDLYIWDEAVKLRWFDWTGILRWNL